MLAVGLVVVAPGAASACIEAPVPMIGDVAEAGLGGRFPWVTGTMVVEGVYQCEVAAWAPALPPVTSQNAAYQLRRVWGRPTAFHPRGIPAERSAPRATLLPGMRACGSVALPKPGHAVITVVGKDTRTDRLVSYPVGLEEDRFSYRAITQAEVRVLTDGLGEPERLPVDAIGVAVAWLRLWWPHALATVLGMMLFGGLRRHVAGRTGASRGHPTAPEARGGPA